MWRGCATGRKRLSLLCLWSFFFFVSALTPRLRRAQCARKLRVTLTRSMCRKLFGKSCRAIQKMACAADPIKPRGLDSYAAHIQLTLHSHSAHTPSFSTHARFESIETSYAALLHVYYAEGKLN